MSFLFGAFCTCQQAEPRDKASDAEEPTQTADDNVLEVSQDEKQVAVTAVPVQKSPEDDRASDQSTVATAGGGSQEILVPAPEKEEKKELETKKDKVKAEPEHLTTLAENNFDDRGTSSLDEKKNLHLHFAERLYS